MTYDPSMGSGAHGNRTMGNRLTGFLRRLVNSGAAEPTDDGSASAVVYKGFEIRPAARLEGSQWLTAGVISKRVGDGVKEHHFVRVDKHATKDGADAFSIIKAKQIIDEQGDRLFEQSEC